MVMEGEAQRTLVSRKGCEKAKGLAALIFVPCKAMQSNAAI